MKKVHSNPDLHFERVDLIYYLNRVTFTRYLTERRVAVLRSPLSLRRGIRKLKYQ